MAVEAWKTEAGVCLRVESVVLQPAGVDRILVNLTMANGSNRDVAYEYGQFAVVSEEGASFLAGVQTPGAQFQVVRAGETKWEQFTFQIPFGVPLRELIWTPSGLPEIRVPLEGDMPITTE